MKTVHKYSIFNGFTSLPLNAEVLTAGIQDGAFFIWAKVDTDQKTTENREFYCAGTGWDITRLNLKYISTVFEDRFVWHVFEVL